MKKELSYETLMENLADQLDFLETSVLAYDKGYGDEIIRQAAIVRILIDDTTYNTSLLSKMGRKGIQFLDSSTLDKTLTSGEATPLLTPVEIDSVSVNLPILDDGPTPLKIDFDRWWEAIVLVDMEGTKFSRNDIVNHFAQKPTIHIDTSLDSAYSELKAKYPLGWQPVDEEAPSAESEDFIGLSMRQITHEVLKTIKLDYACHRNKDGSTVQEQLNDLAFADAAMFPPSKEKAVTDMDRKKVGRNDPCPCGSGKKFKKCCMLN